MAVQVHADHWPVQARRDLFNMGRFPGPVIALDHHPAIELEARQQRHRGLRIETVGFVNRRHIFSALFKAEYDHISVEAEHFTDIDLFRWLHALEGVAIAHHGHTAALSSSLIKGHLTQPRLAPSVTLGEVGHEAAIHGCQKFPSQGGAVASGSAKAAIPRAKPGSERTEIDANSAERILSTTIFRTGH